MHRLAAPITYGCSPDHIRLQVEAFLFGGVTPADVNRQHAALTGVTPLPPLFALGYHQCR